MKRIISKTFIVLSYISAVLLAVVSAFTIYDWMKLSKTLLAKSFEFWSVVHTNALFLLCVAGAGLVFSLATFIINFKGEENVKLKYTARNFLCLFIVGTAAAIILYLSPIELPAILAA